MNPHGPEAVLFLKHSDLPPGTLLRKGFTFGTSMMPFIQPGEEIDFKPVNPFAVRPGDILAFLSRRSPNGLIVHRLIRVFKFMNQQIFLTKGDNRLRWDSPVTQDHLVARVASVGNRNLARPVWRWLSRILAWFSYFQGTFYHCFARSRLNRIRSLCEARGWLPQGFLLPYLRKIVHPLSWIASIQLKCRFRLPKKVKQRLRQEGITLDGYLPGEEESMAKIWNTCYPDHPTTPERLRRILCHSAWFDSEGCFLLKKRGTVMGWGLSAFHGKRAGFVDAWVIPEHTGGPQADALLLFQLTNRLRKKGARQITLGPLLISGDVCGALWNRSLAILARQGFQLTQILIEQRVDRFSYRTPDEKTFARDLTVRPVGVKDERALLEFSIRNGTPPLPDSVKGFLIALQGNQIVGCARRILQHEIQDYKEAGLLWSVHTPPVLYGIFSHFFVGRSYCGKGIGRALARRAFEDLFQTGCQEIRLREVRDELYRRFGFEKQELFAAMQLGVDPEKEFTILRKQSDGDFLTF